MVVKARHQGNSTILTIPKHIKVPADTEFKVYQDNDGNIVYEPIKKNDYDLWADPKFKNLDYNQIRREEFQDLGYNPREVPPVGKEKNNA